MINDTALLDPPADTSAETAPAPESAETTPPAEPGKTGTIFDEIDTRFDRAPKKTSEAPEQESENQEPDGGEEAGKEKTPAEYAAQRRAAKEERKKLLEAAPKLMDENQKLKSELEKLQKTTEEKTEEEAVLSTDVETLKAQLDEANKRYMQAYEPQIDPAQDQDVQTHLQGIRSAFKTNLPRMITGPEGEKVRLNFDGKFRPGSSEYTALEQMAGLYAAASTQSDDEKMNRIVQRVIEMTGADPADEEIHMSVENALASATEPSLKALERYEQVQSDAAQIVQQRRAEQQAKVQAHLMAPTRMDATAVESTLKENPSSGWANFGALYNEMPDDFRSAFEDEIRRDSAVVAAMNYQAPPPPSNATAEQLTEHSAAVRVAESRAMEIAQMAVVGSAMIDGGLLAHLLAEANQANQRAEEHAASTSVSPGAGGESKPKEQERAGTGFYSEISNNY